MAGVGGGGWWWWGGTAGALNQLIFLSVVLQLGLILRGRSYLNYLVFRCEINSGAFINR